MERAGVPNKIGILLDSRAGSDSQLLIPRRESAAASSSRVTALPITVDHPADMAVGPPLGEKGAISNGGSDRVAVKVPQGYLPPSLGKHGD